MKLIPVAISLGLFVTGAVQAQAASVEERLALLEQRLKMTEQRATAAENEVRQMKQRFAPLSPQAAPNALSPTGGASTGVTAGAPSRPAPTLTLNGFGDLKLYGDVEFNVDAASRSGQLTSVKTRADNKNWKPGSTERWDVNGRILIGLDGYRRQDNGNYAGFSVQPLANMNGNMGLDDAAFFFGNEKNWQAKIGRFEAWDMFPLNQDTFIEYSGNTANDLYADGYGYIYMMKEGRGRSSDGGNIMLSKYLGDWYLEVNTLFEEGSSLYSGGEYHGNALENKKNAIYVRPVVAWKGENLSVAVAMESNVVSNAYGYYNTAGEWRDQSKRTGYGATVGWNSLATDPENGVQINLSSAYLDATDEQDLTLGANVLWRRFELGYIFAHNNIKEFNLSGANVDLNEPLNNPGKYDIHTLHASYLIPNIFDMKNFNLYLGAYTSWLQKDNGNQLVSGENDERYGLRARFKYLF
ncbi:porin [Affinibrenneria salicis]|uniref:Porin n=1 Tax=Affinibrenneria salicis TaxID=2590031 RepID=A0A5J5FS91_9GAMM|nr:carbohydrate porin [Affinibrenneria salicis]KAA8995608.1 porin [Affinibrenneria salicis]